MIGAGILKFLSGINLYDGRLDEDFVDRLNNSWSSYLFIIFAIIISAKQMFGNAISCWFPAEFPGAWIQYAENYCWVQNTYFVRTNQSIPDRVSTRRELELSYYQWVPFVLAIQALLFYIPAMIWRLSNWQTGVNIRGLMDIANKKDEDVQERSDRVKNLLTHHASFHNTKGKNLYYQASRILVCFAGNQRFDNYLAIMYVISKLLYLGNVVGQFYLVKAFIGMKDDFYGFRVLSDIAHGHEWHITGHFPYVTLCDFTVRALGHWHKYSVQCVLPVNMLNEKIYVFVFFWLLFVATLTAMNLIYWLYRIFIQNGENLLKKYIKEDNPDDPMFMPNLSRLARKELRRDGIFVLRLMSFNVGEVVTSNVINKIWDERKQATPPIPTFPQSGIPLNPMSPNPERLYPDPKDIDLA